MIRHASGARGVFVTVVRHASGARGRMSLWSDMLVVLGGVCHCGPTC